MLQVRTRQLAFGRPPLWLFKAGTWEEGEGAFYSLSIFRPATRHTHTHSLTRWDVTISRHYMPAQLFIGSIIYRQQLVRLFLLLQHIIIVPFLQTLTKFLSDIFWYSSTIRHVLSICICIRIWQYFISTIRQIAAVALLPEIQTVFRFSISAAAVPPHVQIDTIFS